VAPTLCIVTGGDSRFFPLLRGAVESVRARPEGRAARLGVLDLGLSAEERVWIERHADVVAVPEWHHEFPGRDHAPFWMRGLLASPLLREYFPGAEVYLWLDADAFVLNWHAVELFVQGARARGMAIVPELDRGSRLQYGVMPVWWQDIARWYDVAFGPAVAEELMSFPVLNIGALALHRDAPHWSAWNAALSQAVRSGAQLMSCQIALNYGVYKNGLLARTELLPAWCHWPCNIGPPAWDLAQERLVEPYLPHNPIGILHRSGADKNEVCQVPCVSGGTTPVRLRFPPCEVGVELPSGPLLPGDYVSPGLKVVMPDACFPNLVKGDTTDWTWPFVRKDIPHRVYVDRRRPRIGFVNRDEAMILYNTALRFRGKRALEIGCWLGWSTCHLALGGVSLDVLDAGLTDPGIRGSVESSLTAAGVRGRVNLVAASSPEGVGALAGGRKWSLFFVDGSHDSPAPLRDAQACAAHAEDDALILFHDLAAPAVGEALDWLREQGWRTCIYHTMQIMGVAWRGSVAPVAHRPDPTIAGPLPEHLQGHPVG
jgi:hypothetical protein